MSCWEFSHLIKRVGYPVIGSRRLLYKIESMYICRLTNLEGFIGCFYNLVFTFVIYCWHSLLSLLAEIDDAVCIESLVAPNMYKGRGRTIGLF